MGLKEFAASPTTQLIVGGLSLAVAGTGLYVGMRNNKRTNDSIDGVSKNLGDLRAEVASAKQTMVEMPTKIATEVGTAATKAVGEALDKVADVVATKVANAVGTKVAEAVGGAVANAMAPVVDAMTSLARAQTPGAAVPNPVAAGLNRT